MQRMNSNDLLEVMRTIICMSYDEFVQIYGKNLANHIHQKMKNKHIAFIYELDNGNWKALYEYACNKVEGRRESKEYASMV